MSEGEKEPEAQMESECGQGWMRARTGQEGDRLRRAQALWSPHGPQTSGHSSCPL